MKHIPSDRLQLSEIPPDDAEMHAIEMFALTFNGYAFWGDSCFEQAGSDCLCIDHIRARLFCEQRAGRHAEGLGRHEAVSLLRELRLRLASDDPKICVKVPPPYGIADLLTHFGFNIEIPAKLVRHRDKRYDIQELIDDGWFDLYQSTQKSDIFGECEFIVSFKGEGSTRARLIGVYRVLNPRERTSRDIPAESPFGDWAGQKGYIYDLVRQPDYAGLEGRVVIEWGPGVLAWHQHLNLKGEVRNKEVVQIDPAGRFLAPFSDYLDFSLSHHELRRLLDEPSAHRDWRASLSAVAGVYLILDEVEGRQYVGSAYGADGFWGRWSDYASNGHGGNKYLKKIVECSEDYPKRFRFSILQVLPKSTKAKEVIRWETRFKRKLGCRATGLNSN